MPSKLQITRKHLTGRLQRYGIAASEAHLTNSQGRYLASPRVA